MNSRELVCRAIHFGTPERLPFTGSMGETDFSGDTVAVFPDFGHKWWLGGGGVDEWGSLWVADPGSKDMGQVKNIVLQNLSDWKTLAVPDAASPARYAGWKEILDRAEKEEKYAVVCNGPYLFERAHFLHGFENTLTDCLLEPELTAAFLRRLAEYHFRSIETIRKRFAGRVHGYRGTDDWGTQLAPLVSPEVFRRLFKPVYREIFSAIHEAGMDVWMHSCGQVTPLMDDFIEMGLDVINLMQPNVLPISALREFRGRLCFEVSADAQNTLLTGSPEDLKAEIGSLLGNCCAETGGLIEALLDRMYLEEIGVRPEYGSLCHEEYRRRDPFLRTV